MLRVLLRSTRVSTKAARSFATYDGRKGGDLGEEWEWDSRLDGGKHENEMGEGEEDELASHTAAKLRSIDLPNFEVEGADGSVDFVPDAGSMFAAVDEVADRAPLPPSEREALLSSMRGLSMEDASAFASALGVSLPRGDDRRGRGEDDLDSVAPEEVGKRRLRTENVEEGDFERYLQTDLRFLNLPKDDKGMQKPMRPMPLWMLYEVAQSDIESDDEEADGGKKKRDRTEPAIVRRSMIDEQGRAWVVGRRKTAHALVSIQLGDGEFRVNKKLLAEYFADTDLRRDILAPMSVLRVCGAFDVDVTVRGGGTSGQAGAVKLGVARALAKFDPYLRPRLKALKMIQRDPRMVERKKPGQKKARKKFQWVKR